MKRALSYLTIIVLFSIIQHPHQMLDYSLQVPEAEGAIGTEEDPEARLEYEELLLRNPQTGTIPSDIRDRELAFSEKLPTKLELAKTNSRITVNEFTLAGPSNVGGRTRAIRLDVRDENTIVAGGVSGGIWKTTDGGSKWSRISSPTLRNSVTSLAQDTRSGHQDTWYFGTGEIVGNSARSVGAPYRGGGIYKSTDNGINWTILQSTEDNAEPDKFTSMFQYIWNIEVNKNNTTQEEVLVASYGGILRSTDGGASWNVMLGQKLFGLDTSADLNKATAPFYTCLKQAANGYFFAALSSATSTDGKLSSAAGYYFSSNGKDWQSITPPNLNKYHERTVIGMDANTENIYFLTQGDGVVYLWKYSITGFVRNRLSGIWTNLSDNIPYLGGQSGDYDSQGGYNMVMEVHPTQSNVLFIGGTNLYRSTDGFESTRRTDWVGGYSPVNNASVYPGHYPDQHAMLFFPSDPSKAISTNDGGIRLTKDCLADSLRWISLNNGFVTSQFYSVFQRKDLDTNEIIGGMQDQGTYMRTISGENPAWSRVLGGDGGYAAITPNRDFVYMEFQNGQIYRILLNKNLSINSYARIDPLGGGETGPGYLFVNPYILDPTNATRMFVLGGDHIWRNSNLVQIPGGTQNRPSVNWTKLNTTRLVGDGLYSCLDKSLTGDYLFAGVNMERPYVMRLNNASFTNSETPDKLTSDLFPTFGYISCIAIHPENPEHFVVTFSNYGVKSIFKTDNGGNTFEEIGGNLEDETNGGGYGPSVRWTEIVPTTTGTTYFVGTSTGLFSTDQLNGTNTVWVQEGEETIGNAVVTMLDYRDIDGRLVVGTHGNGVFQTYISNYRKFELSDAIPAKLTQGSAFPNPFSNSVSIPFTLPEDGEVTIDLYDTEGNFIRNLLWGPQYKGTNYAKWDGTNNSGIRVRSGAYMYRILYKDQQQSGRVVLID